MISEKAFSILKKINLAVEAEELNNVLENILEDLPHYIMRFEGMNSYSPLLAQARSLGIISHTSGALFNTKRTNLNLRKSYREFVESNKFVLSRELACAMCPLKYSSLRVSNETSKYEVSALRRLIHKAYYIAECSGDEYFTLSEWLSEAEIEAPKMGGKVVVCQDSILFNQKGSSLYRCSDNSVACNVLSSEKRFPLKVESVMFGSIITNEKEVPVFNLDNPKGLYVLAKSPDSRAHIAFFSDVSPFALRKRMKINSWEMYGTYDSRGTFLYTLEGTSGGSVGMRLYGIVPFIHPKISR